MRKTISLSNELHVIMDSIRGVRSLTKQWIDSFGMDADIPQQVSALLGHSSPNMTLRYAHLIPGTGDNVRAVLDGLSKATTSPSAEPRVGNRTTTAPDSSEADAAFTNECK